MINLSKLPAIPASFSARFLQLAPKIAKPICHLVPFSIQQRTLLATLKSIFHEAIEDGDFDFLQDNWLKIAVPDLDLNWWLSFDGETLIMKESEPNEMYDVSFSANGDDLILIAARKEDPDTLFFQRRLKIEGDTELGLALKNVIDSVDLDELPSKIHWVVNTLANVIVQSKANYK
jgi:predicted lipid carrier protein YhbT